MTLWPFRRKSARKRPRSGAALSDPELPPPPDRPEPPVTRAASKKKQRTEPAKLQRRPRAYSYSPGRRDSIRLDQPHRRPPRAAGLLVDDADPQPPMPTLHHRASQLPARRRSSKRRREDHEREAEIKAMSALTSARMAVDARASASAFASASAAAAAPTKRSSKRVKTASCPPAHWDKPASNVSLPLFDSIHSSQSSDSDCVSFKVSALDALAPRPTLRCASGSSRWTPSRASAPTRSGSGSQKKSLAEREAIAEEALDSRKRIDSLADGLDASDLRELMERDNRRRQRKRQHDQERTERRLARRADRQRREEAEAHQSGTLPPQNLERGVLGRELVGLGIEPPSAVVTSSRKREKAPASPEPMSDVEEARPRGEPLAFFHRTDTIPLDEEEGEIQPTAEQADVEPEEEREREREQERVEGPPVPQVRRVPPTEPEEPVSALPHGSILAGILRSKKSQSKSTLSSDRDRTTLEDDAPRKDSDSNKTGRLSLISFLRRGGRNRRNSGPSSFSNTSREEMQAVASAQAEALARLQGDDPAAPPQANYLASKPGAGGPKRTRSRFREDLPDYPLSPPDSRVQSPEAAEPPLPVVDEVKTPVTESRPPSPAMHDSPCPGARPIEAKPRRPTSMERLHGAVSPDPPLSMSLASIDSEGSWLSGRVGRRSAMRDGRTQTARRDKPGDSPASSTHEDVIVAGDEYLSRLASSRNSGEMAVERPSGDGRPSSDDERMQEGDVRWGAVGAAKPRVIRFHRHDRDTMRSREGLLNIYPDSEVDGEARVEDENGDGLASARHEVGTGGREPPSEALS
ncbi:hypothetical protein CDD83_5978 [Cordyceps sp. RAO-2017]|nr:hypothetical protein CDD83_5978 [Cordyceps sp. RAO-2017]